MYLSTRDGRLSRLASRPLWPCLQAERYSVEVYGYDYVQNKCADIIDTLDFSSNLAGAQAQFTQAGATNGVLTCKQSAVT